MAVHNEFTGYAYIVLVLVLGPTDHDLSARSKLHMYCIYVANAIVTSMNSPAFLSTIRVTIVIPEKTL